MRTGFRARATNVSTSVPMESPCPEQTLYGCPGEALAIIAEGGGTPAGIVIALDRQERVREDAAESAAQAVAAEHGIAVVAVAGLADLLEFAGERAELVGHRDALLAYRARYGIA